MRLDAVAVTFSSPEFSNCTIFDGFSTGLCGPIKIMVEILIEETEHLRVAIAQLKREFEGDPRTLRAFEEYVLKERNAADVAAELGMKVNGVHQAKTRISEALRVRLAELEEGLR